MRHSCLPSAVCAEHTSGTVEEDETRKDVRVDDVSSPRCCSVFFGSPKVDGKEAGFL